VFTAPTKPSFSSPLLPESEEEEVSLDEELDEDESLLDEELLERELLRRLFFVVDGP